MSRNNPGAEVDPSEGPLENTPSREETAGNEAEEQVDPSEDTQ